MIRKLYKKHFWKWFVRNNEEFLSFNKKSPTEKNYWLKELNTHLRVYGRFMRFEMELSGDHKTGVLTITADGKEKYFDKIDYFISFAPELANWKIHALIQPKPATYNLEEDFCCDLIDPDDLWFHPTYHPYTGELLDFIIYSPMFTESNSEEIYPIVESILWNILGERVFAERIRDIEIEKRSRAPRKGKLIKLEELPAYLGPGRSCMVVNSEGQLR